MVKTATFEALLEDARPDGEGGFTFTLEGKTYRIRDRDEVRRIAEQHGYSYLPCNCPGRPPEGRHKSVDRLFHDLFRRPLLNNNTAIHHNQAIHHP